MGVLQNYRGQGIGKKVIYITLSTAKKFGIEGVELLGYSSNFVAMNFCEKIDFVFEGQRGKPINWIEI
jgi:predicted N-acetyltransferase YhbS